MMILALIKAQFLSLLRDRMAIALSFALPCVMFTVFALIFGGMGRSKPQPLKVLIADLDQSQASARMITSLKAMDRLQVRLVSDASAEPGEVPEDSPQNSRSDEDDRKEVIAAVQGGKAAAGVIFPKGLENSFAIFGRADRPAIELICDTSNPMAEQMLTGVLQASAFTSSPDILLDRGLEQFRNLGGAFSPLQESAVQAMKQFLRRDTVAGSSESVAKSKQSADARDPENGSSSPAGLSMTDGLVRIQAISAQDVGPSVTGSRSRSDGENMISYYAAGISVMFIMFSMSGAASGLIEHRERGTLERLLSGRMRMFHLLASHWVFTVLLGCLQIGLMFGFASLVFGLEILEPEVLIGASLMALVSSMASAAFILMIATLCQSRKQLEGLSSIIILIMSAIGGSMMPRFIMPSFVVKFSSIAFNAWSMDGFLKVFWYRTPDSGVVSRILPEVTVILLMAGVFLVIAGLGARRWQRT